MLIFSRSDFVKILNHLAKSLGTEESAGRIKESLILPVPVVNPVKSCLFRYAFSNLVNFDTDAPERIVAVLKNGKLFQKLLCKEWKALACHYTTLSLFAMSKAQSLCTTHNHFVKTDCLRVLSTLQTG